MRIETRWTSPRRFTGTAESGATLVMDSRSDQGGEGAGPTPMEAVLMALAGCTGMDVLDILKKMRAPLDTFAIAVDAQRAHDHPRVFTRIHVRYMTSGPGLKPEQVEKAVGLSYEKYCPVMAMLKQSAEITFEVVVSADR